ncbi:MAG TPA: hypothetical protein VE134_07815, partial [Methanomicrobiales archaeon]|nr:hypothetical protein [Methanomicrobiales archaeon]
MPYDTTSSITGPHTDAVPDSIGPLPIRQITVYTAPHDFLASRLVVLSPIAHINIAEEWSQSKTVKIGLEGSGLIAISLPGLDFVMQGKIYTR